MALLRVLKHPARLAGTGIARSGGPRLHTARLRLFRAASAGLWVPWHVALPGGGPVRYSVGGRPSNNAVWFGNSQCAQASSSLKLLRPLPTRLSKQVVPPSTPLACVDIFSTKFRSRTARSLNSCRCDRSVARYEYISLLESNEYIPFDTHVATGFRSAVCRPLCPPSCARFSRQARCPREVDVQLLLAFAAKTAGSKRALLAVI